MRRITAKILFLTFSTLAFCLISKAQAEEIIRIVSSLPRTGSVNAQTDSIVNGIRLALEDANFQAAGFRIVYNDWDDASPERGQWDPSAEAANADKAIADPDVMVVIGPYNSGAAKISMPKLNQAQILQISPGASYPGLTKPKLGEPNEPKVYRPSGKVSFYRVVPADDIQGLVAAQWAKELGAKKVFILHDRELYGLGIAKIFRKSAPLSDLKIMGFEGIDPKASNYKSLATKIKQTSPDVVFYGGTTQTNAGQIAKDLRAGGVTAKFMVPDGCFETAFITAAGAENLEGNAYVTFGGVPADKLVGKGREFFIRYRQRFGIDPEGYAAYGYESASVALEAIRRAKKKDRAAIMEAAATIQDFNGILGKWSFDENGDTSLKTMSGNIVKSGKFEFVKLLGQ